MNILSKNIKIKQLLNPTGDQILFTSIGLVLYFIYQSYHEKIFNSPQTLANTVIYISDVTSILLICTLTFIGNRYITLRYNLNKKTSSAIIIKNNTKQLILSTLYSFCVFNLIFAPVFYINNSAEFAIDIKLANIYGIPFIIIYYFIDYSRRAINNYKELLISIDKLEKEKLNTELQLLRAQFNPHFIFNAINTIYFQIEENNTHEKLIMPHFKQMVHYLTNVCSSEQVPLNQEIDYIKNYLDIQLLGKGEQLKKSINITQCTSNLKISPFILQPFIENAFKYISGNMELSINLKLMDNMLFYKIKNSIDPKYLKVSKKEGIGLINLQKRLNQIYPGKHYFKCEQLKDSYISELKIKLN